MKAPSEFRFQIGVTARDEVTGFEGVITGRAQHLTGCNTYGLMAPAKDGKISAPEWFDENRLFVTNAAVVQLPGDARVEASAARDKGPCGSPAPTRTVG